MLFYCSSYFKIILIFIIEHFQFEMLDKVTKYSQSVKYFVRVCAFRDWMDHSVVVMEMMDSDLKSFQRRQNIRALELRFIHKMALQVGFFYFYRISSLFLLSLSHSLSFWDFSHKIESTSQR